MPRLAEIARHLADQPNLVLTATPGAGKTTLVPWYLLDTEWLRGQRILMLEPRRVAARLAAQRIALLDGSRVGERIGYRVRFDSKVGRATRLEIVTEALLTRRCQADPTLDSIGLVVFDEAHERHLHTDLGLALVREIQQTVREDLRVLVMSATLDTERFARFLGDCPRLSVDGRQHPVTFVWAERPDSEPIATQAANAVRRILEDSAAPRGDVLVFLPGAREIRDTTARLASAGIGGTTTDGPLVLPLHGSLPPEEQERALRPADRRKVIVATNLAETSVTIDGVAIVIDTGWCRQPRLDPQTGLERLELVRISQAAADQRAGRAGRQGPGLAIRTWTRAEHAVLPPTTEPEIARVDLAGLRLELAGWGHRDLAAVAWLEPPPAAAIDAGERLLAYLGAIAPDGSVTPLGRRMLRLPLSPRLARVALAAADSGSAAAAARLAAALDADDAEAERVLASIDGRPDGRGMPGFSTPAPATRPAGPVTDGFASGSDRQPMTATAPAAPHRADPNRGGPDPSPPGEPAWHLRAATEQILRDLRALANPHGHPSAATSAAAGTRHAGAPAGATAATVRSDRPERETLLRALLQGFPDRVARRRDRARPGDPERYRMVGGRGLQLDPRRSRADPADWLLVLAAEPPPHGEPDGAIRLGWPVTLAWILDELGHLITTDEVVEFADDRNAVQKWRRRRLFDLVLTEDRLPWTAADGDPAAAALAAEVRRQPRAALGWDDDCDQLAWRLDLWRRHHPASPTPSLDDEFLRQHADTLVGNCRSLAELRRRSLASALAAIIPYQIMTAIDRQVPSRITVPTGSRLRVQYRPDAPPVLAVKLQELFGQTATPTLLDGRVPITLHLLSPGGKPLQVTADLASFWRTAYPALRREMQARYPRHPWPEDPLTAPPQRGPKRR